MFREMREVGVPLSKEKTIQMLETQKHGALAVNGDDGYAYSVCVLQRQGQPCKVVER